MGPMDRQIEREEQAIQDDHERGDITNAEMNRQIRELHQAYRAEAEEASEQAYRDEMGRW